MNEQELRDCQRYPGTHDKAPKMYLFISLRAGVLGKPSCLRAKPEGFVPAASQLFNYVITTSLNYI